MTLILENIKIALAFQREIINNILPHVRPDLIHCNDWMTGLIPAAARQMGIPCLFTIHNIHTVETLLDYIEDRGIDAALSAVVGSAPIPISVQVDPDLDLSTDVAETVYFVANEAIANVLKHAGARVASVHVAKNAANVRVTVHDDGRGGVVR